MKVKWKVLWLFVALYLVGVIGGAWHTYGATNAQDSAPLVEAIKIAFIMLGGLGVIIPTYLNVWQSLETSEVLSDQMRRTKIENTYKIIEKWDDKSLLEARRFTRELKTQHSTLSPDALKGKVDGSADLKQSLILVFNYFEQIRVSIKHDRVDAKVVSESLGGVFHDIYERFGPWIKIQNRQYQEDLEETAKMLPKPKNS